METRAIVGGTLLAVLGVGGSAMIGAEEDLTFYIGLAAVLLSILGLILLAVWPKKRAEAANKESGTVTAKLRGGSTIELDDSFSSADTLVDAQDNSKAVVRHSAHKPNRELDK